MAENSSVRAAQILLQNDLGFQPKLLQVLKGGIFAWRDAGFNLESGLAVESKNKKLALWARLKHR
ncbi:hypothetical protein CMK18_01180 [Candidatus Poribacteria bacterium]|nr:hypothetical protein [Candidatus Poribacteria bacterium]